MSSSLLNQTKKHVQFSEQTEQINQNIYDDEQKEIIEYYENSDNEQNIQKPSVLDEEDTLQLLDKFLQIYNTKHNSPGSFFVGVDIKNPVATNDRMETFYEYLKEYEELQKQNPSYIDVYEPGMTIENGDSNEIYALVTGKDSKIVYLSLSYISLLTVGIKTKDIGKDWSIIKL
jgi:hypothetical protein